MIARKTNEADVIMTIPNVLFVCRDNAIYSIMAEAYATHAGRGVIRAYSAGVTPDFGIDPLAFETVRNMGLRPSGLHAKSVRIFCMPNAPTIEIVVILSTTDDSDLDAAVPDSKRSLKWPVIDLCQGSTSQGSRALDYMQAMAEIRMMCDSLLLDRPGLAYSQPRQVA